MHHSYVWHAACTRVTCLIHMCDVTFDMWDMTFLHMCHDSFILYVWHVSIMRRSKGASWLVHVWHDSFMCVTWRIHMCGIPHSWASHSWFICVTRLFIHTCDMTHPLVTWFIHKCDMTHSYVTSLIHKCDMTLSYVTRLIKCDMTHSYVAWLIHKCDMTHLYVWHDFLRYNDSENSSPWHMSWLSSWSFQLRGLELSESRPTYEWVMAHVQRSHVTQIDLPCHTYERVTSHIWLSRVTRVN